MKSEPEKEPVDSLTRDMFRKVRCPIMDALTVFIPKDQEPSPQIQKVLDEAGDQRWFPNEQGHLVKIRNVFDTYDDNLFKLEKNGWNHEHCDKCGGTIDPEDECWYAEVDDRFFLFCDTCYQKFGR